MFQIFGSLKEFIKPPTYIIDNCIYRLHYKATALLLLGFSLLVTARQYFGDPMDCITRDYIPLSFLDTYCWIHGTFSVENAWKKRVDSEVPYPGVQQSQPSEHLVHHTYYQWVGFVLFFQAVIFYAPHYLWDRAEGGLVKHLIMGLNKPILDKEDRMTSIHLVADYLLRNMYMHKRYFVMYAITELINFVNVIGQMKLIDHFLGGEFFNYGWQVMSFTGWDGSVRYDPMLKVFPRLAKCTFHQYGPSGDVQRHDALCILPMNIVNEKVYLFLWFWFYFLLFASGLALLYRLATITLVRVRVTATYSHCRFSHPDSICTILATGNVGDWFLLDLLSKNMDPLNFRDLLLSLNGKLEPKNKSTVPLLGHKQSDSNV